MNTPDIVLHQWCISPFCVKVQKVLELKGLPYRVEEYGGMRALSPKGLSVSGKLPVLDYDGERVSDSTAIARMLDARHPTPPLYPSATAERHLVHLLEDWADESLYWYELWLRLYDEQALDKAVAVACEGRPSYERPLFKFGMGRYRRWLDAQGLGRYPRDKVIANFREHLDALEGRLSTGPWLVGSAPSIADLAVAAQLDEVVRTSSIAYEVLMRPKLADWRERCQFGARARRPAASRVGVSSAS